MQASGSPSLTSAATFQTQLRSLPAEGVSFISGVTVASVSRLIVADRRIHTIVVGADLEGLFSSHDQPSLVVLLVLEETYITSASFLPFLVALFILVYLVKFGTHFEDHFLRFFVRLGIDLFR